MSKTIKAILIILIFGYTAIFFDAYIFGTKKSNEKVHELDFRLSRGKGSADRYWMYTEKGKVNVDYDLYAALSVGRAVRVYRSNLFNTPLRVDCEVGGSFDTYNVCFTKTKSGKALMALFFAITLITLLLIKRGTYWPGKLGLTILLIILFLVTVGDHVFA